MKKYMLAISVLIFALAACNGVSGTPSNMPEVLPVSPTLEPATAVPAIEASPTVEAPTFTPVVPVQPAVLPPVTSSPPNQPNRIKFDVGGTWVDLPDSRKPGTRKTYNIKAMQGQIMSISLLAGNDPGVWGYFPIEVKGEDGTVFCPVDVNYECSFWRGKLPATQNYFITVKAAGDLTNFTLRVAVNPPGQSGQTFQYKNPATGLTLSYSDQFAPTRFPSTANNKITPELVLQFIDTNSYTKTNLGEVYFLLGSSSDPQVVTTCADAYQSGGGPEEPDGNVVVNGINFVRSLSSGVGAGNIYEQEIYRAVKNNVCYEVIYFIHSSNIGNYTPGAVTEFDRNSLMKKLNNVLAAFNIQ